MRADVKPGKAHGGHGGQDGCASRRAEMGGGHGTESGGHACVPGQVTEPGSLCPAAACGGHQFRGPRPAHHPLDHLGERPGAGAGRQQPPGEVSVVSQPGHAGGGRYRAKGAGLHDDPGRQVQRVWQAVHGPEQRGLGSSHMAPAHQHGGDRDGCRAQLEPDPRVGQHLRQRTFCSITRPLRELPRELGHAAVRDVVCHRPRSTPSFRLRTSRSCSLGYRPIVLSNSSINAI
jgi:hypothetical protein